MPMLGTSYSTSARRTTAILLPRISRRWRPRFFSQRLPSSVRVPHLCQSFLQELDIAKERDVRMATLLGYTLDPKRDPREVLSRKALLSELISKGILSLVSTEARQVWALFEKEFPLWICANTRRPCSLRSAPRLWSCLRPAPFLRLSSRSSSRACAALLSCACFSNLPRCSRR